jgi:hypothetical protein
MQSDFVACEPKDEWKIKRITLSLHKKLRKNLQPSQLYFLRYIFKGEKALKS